MPEKNSNPLIIFKFCSVLILILALISFVVDSGVKKSRDDQTGKVNLIMNHNIDPDLIVFGSSVGEVGINSNLLSRLTGLTVYNCSIDGTPYIQYKGLLDEFNNYSKNSRYVIFMESYFSLQKISGVSSADRYLAWIKNPNIFESLYYLQPGLIWKCRYIPFYKYVAATHVYYKNSVSGFKNYFNHHDSGDSLNGQRRVYRRWESDQDEILMNMKPFTIEIDPYIIKNYIATISSLEKNNKKVFIVLPPFYAKLSKQLTDFNPLRKTLDSITKVTGAKFIDFSSSDICEYKSFFYNTTHLNVVGAEKFTLQLADSLEYYFKK
jgi:hypothetical protein